MYFIVLCGTKLSVIEKYFSMQFPNNILKRILMLYLHLKSKLMRYCEVLKELQSTTKSKVPQNKAIL